MAQEEHSKAEAAEQLREELARIERNLRTISQSERLIAHTLKKIQVPDIAAWKKTMKTPPPVPESLYLPEDVGQGLMFEYSKSIPKNSAPPATVAARHSTEEEDKKAKAVVLLGVDFTGRAYAAGYFQQLAPLLQDAGLKAEEVVVHHYTPDIAERHNLLWQLDEDAGFTHTQARHIAGKYILSRLKEPDGSLKQDPLAGGNMEVTLLAHSFGCGMCQAVQNAVREALFKDPAAYNLPEKYPREVAEKIMDELRIIGLGVELVVHDTAKEEDRIYIPTMQVLGADDAMPSRSAKTLGLALRHAEDAACHTALDPYDAQRMEVVLPQGMLKAEEGGRINVGGHGLEFYVHALREEKAARGVIDGIQSMIRRDRTPEDIAAALNARVMDIQALKEDASALPKDRLAEGFLKMLEEERRAWEKTPRTQHPLER